jgi:C-terminal processing protease CtpA/Prc
MRWPSSARPEGRSRRDVAAADDAVDKQERRAVIPFAVLDWPLEGRGGLGTTGRLADLAPPQEPPVSVLVGERTFSSGEGLAYHLQSHGRAKLVGQTTPGAADHITPVRLTRHVRALMPEARVRDAVTGTNWEGTGVVPDVPCEPANALNVAIEALAPGHILPRRATL